ncbi:hypothetical protein PoB_001043600 [Plakobranchus ocellatus]|uniref:Uncharacterized protein n=1 Tax=Plakobranchus ocellatus TaxID=259542 RepID=A0AAV3Y9J0_9GAST|nr:hypothetical protein PoB_001043600 [Plakobranchus ocellatus]
MKTAKTTRKTTQINENNNDIDDDDDNAAAAAAAAAAADDDDDDVDDDDVSVLSVSISSHLQLLQWTATAMYSYYTPEVTSPLSERNGQKEKKSWNLPLSENDFVTMQQKMLGLNTQQKNIMREYEDELDAMKSEIKKIRVDYDGLKQKNSRYRAQLKEKSEQLKRMAEEQARVVRRTQTVQPEETWSIEKTKLLARIKQLEVERKQAEERCRDLLNTKEENSTLKRELESLKFRENLWKEEKEMAERKRRKINEHKDNTIVRYSGSVQNSSKQPMSMDWSSSNVKSTFTFDDAFEQMTRSDVPYKSLPAINILNYTESNDLQDIRKSLNEAREELILAKNDAQTKKDQFLTELKEREDLQKTVRGLKDQRETDTAQVREKITTMESKIASLESNCLTEVQNLVRNVDILKQELINSQRELESLKEYSRQMEKKRDEEKMQILNESRELKLDLSSLRTEIRDKSQGSDRTDLSRGPLTDTRERTSPQENFEHHYSPLVGFVGSRCDYLKMKLETLKKHLHNLDCQTQTVLTQSLEEAGETPGPANVDPTGKQRTNSNSSTGSNNNSNNKRLSKPVAPSTLKSNSQNTAKPHTKSNDKKNNKNSNNTNCALVEAIQQRSTREDDDEDDEKCNDDDDEDEIPVLTPRPHRNKYDKDLDTLIVENGENIERLRLPSLEEEDDEEEEGDSGEEDRDNCLSHRDSARELKQEDDVFGERVGGQDFRDFSQGRHQFDRRESPRARRDRSLPVDSRFEKLEQELENRRRKGAMPAYHHLMPKSAH